MKPLVLVSESFSPNSRLLPQGVETHDEELWVVGDVHGQSELLEEAFLWMFHTTKAKFRRVVLLGDLVDRGPNSLAALDLAMTAKTRTNADEVDVLWGNHELMMKDALSVAATCPKDANLDRSPCAMNWLSNGGLTFCEQVLGRSDHGGVKSLLLNMREALGPTRLAWLNTLKSHVVVGNVLMVHAGLVGGKPFSHTLNLKTNAHMNTQTHRRHWAWIRDPFLAWQGGWVDGQHKKKQQGGQQHHLVFHGHTPAVLKKNKLVRVDEDRLVRSTFDKTETHGRVNLDGGAGFGQGVAFARVHNGELNLFCVRHD